VGVLLKMVEIIETIDRLLEPDLVERDDYRYALKRSIIENNIYGVDIQRRAVNLANLRLWLSLIVDLNVKSVKDVPPLPNLDYHIIEGDSLVSKIGEVDFDLERLVKLDTKGTELVDRFIRLKKEHERIPSREKKEKQKQKIEKAKKDLCLWFLKKLKKEKEKELANLYDAKFDFMKDETLFTKQEEKKKERLKEELKTIDKNIKNADTLIKGFNWGLDFFEVLEMRGGFDIVIGNPPYGVKVSDTVKNDFGLGNKDSYGAFTALGLKILRPGGTLCFIMSDTWQTIRTHKPLRDKLLSETDCQYLISCPPDTFGATVNVGVYTFKKRLVPEMGGDNWILAGDFSPLSIEKGELEAAFEMLIEQNEFDETKDGYTIWSDRDMAIFAYRQKLITRFSNHSFFIASPKLFGLMRDVGNIKNELRREDEPPVYSVEFNGKELEMVKLGDVAEVKQGLATGDNYYYLRQSKEKIEGAARNYSVVDLDLVLREDELERIANDEELRKEIIEKGISKRPGNRRYFGGRYFVPYDKGGSSDIDEGWLPNYYVPTDYFIDWSEEAVKRMKTLTIKERDGKGSNKICSRFQNADFYFRKGISFSRTGIYVPTFRLNSASLFDTEGSMIFAEDLNFLIGLLASKLLRLLFKAFIDHTVHLQVEDLKKLMTPTTKDMKISNLVSSIISKQKQNPRYDYMSNEQVEIDRLVYKMYNLNEEDIQEVENWFYRRYPKLARVIEEKRKAISISYKFYK